MGPYGSENFKTLILLQIKAKSLQTGPEFSSHWASENYVWDFWNFQFPIFNDLFFKKFKLTIVAYEEIKKNQLSQNERS